MIDTIHCTCSFCGRPLCGNLHQWGTWWPCLPHGWICLLVRNSSFYWASFYRVLQFHKFLWLLFSGTVLLKIPENMAVSSWPSQTHWVQISRGRVQGFASLSYLFLPLATPSLSTPSSLCPPSLPPSPHVSLSLSLSLSHEHMYALSIKRTRPAGRGSQLSVSVPNSANSHDICCQ